MIVSMKRLSLVALKSDQESILKALQKIGTVQVLKVADGDTQDTELDAVNARIQRLSESINAVKPYAQNHREGRRRSAADGPSKRRAESGIDGRRDRRTAAYAIAPHG